MGVAEVSSWTQLKILLKKNLWLKKRGYIGTICEFLFPAAIIMLGCVYALLFTMFNDVNWKNTSVDSLTTWNNGDPYQDCLTYYNQDANKCFLGIAPDPTTNNDTRLEFIVQGMQEYFYNTTGQNVIIQYFESDSAMKSYYEDDDNKLALWAGVVFTFDDNILNYTIRINNSYIPFSISNSFSQSFGFGDLWDSNGFLTVQTAVETSFIQFTAVNNSLAFTGLFNYIEKFPFDFATSVGASFPLFISGFLMYAFIPLMLNSMVALFRERNEKVKETMKMMGMSESMYWVSWYITVTVPAIWICLAMIILGKACYLFTHSNLFIVFIYALFFAFSVISFTFLMSIWVKGTLVAAVVTFGWLFLMMNAVTFVVNFSAGAQTVLSFISPIAFCLGMIQIVDLDLFKDGVQFSNVTNNDFSVVDAMVMMIVDTIIYSVLNWYFANIFPGEYGIAKSVFFPFQKSYWFPEAPANEEERIMNPISDINLQGKEHSVPDNAFIEPVPAELGLKCGVSIRNLRKVYGDASDPDNCTVAVKGLSVDLYVGEIFGFLGMNGAGKTTTISMLTGLYPPTGGDAFIDGLSIRTSTDLIRKRIGICPQDNILFERLTAREHLTLFGILKGIPQEQIQAKVEEMLVLIGLGDKADKISKTYSGGMKRKLQIGIALMGDSKVVIFDEPTAGMDSVSRRQFWNTLRGMKENRVIILVSHMMEECDVLSDRIGIMKTGEMVCYGTSTFLKNKLGSGDYLNIVGEDNIEKRDVLKFVQKHIPKSKIVSETPTDLSILLPLGTRDKFPDLLGDLESVIAGGKKNELHIKGFGISMTSLEDVFLRITQDDFGPSSFNSTNNLKSINDGSNSNFNSNNNSSNDIKVKIRTPRGSMKQQLLTGNYPAPSWTSHFKLLLQMKLLSARRNWKTTLSLLLVPAIFMFVVIGSGKISNLTIDEGSTSLTQLTFSDFYPLIIPYYEASGVDASPLIQPIQDIQPDTSDLSFISKDSLSSFQDYFFDDDASDRSNHRFGGIQYMLADYGLNLFNYTLVYNTSELNSLPAFTNMMNNAVLKYLVNDTSDLLLISSYSHPFPGSGLNIEFGNDMMMITFSFIVGFSITMGLLTRTIVYEKQKKIQFQYSMLGVNSGVYWVTHYLFDYLLNFLSFLCLSIILAAFDIKEYMHIDFLALTIFTLWFLIALVASNYMLSFLFQDAEDCLKYLFILNLMFGVAPYIAILVFQLAFKTDSMDWLKFLFPMSTYASGLGSIQTVHAIFDITGETKKLSDFFEWDQLGEKMVYIAIHSAVCIVVIIFIDRFSNKIRLPGSADTVPPPPNEDEDVAAERQRLADLDKCDDLIQVKDVMKDYGHFKAVKNITLGIKENECFGLLGPNGAGKTTTISMLTREIEPTSGDVRLCGKSVWSMNKDEHYKIAKPGCCLQFDSLNDYLTGREHLRLYCKLRNDMPADQVEEVVEEYLEKLNIVIHGNKITKNYSGGTKRKLSVALALMTGNQILYLDEPSTGMDPSARRALWTAIETERKKPGRAIVLTTHALEEAEAVSQRIGIVVRGQLQCLGTTQHLKSKFEDKYFLFINSKEPTMEHIDRFVQETFPGATLLESYGGSGIKYDIGRLKSVAYAFRAMEDNKDKLGITEYSITQTTLEHIFLFFAKRQEEATSGVTAWTDVPQHHQCQFCEANMVTETTYKIGKGSWLAGAALTLVCCCCLGCCIGTFKDVQHSCPNCNKIVGVHKKL